MGIRDRAARVGRVLAEAAGEALLDLADGTLTKAAGEPPRRNGKLDQDDQGDQGGVNDAGQDTAPGGTKEDSAKNHPVPDQAPKDDPKSLFFDPFAIIEQLGYRDRPNQISYGTLKSMVWKMPVLQAIIQTRIQQMASFCIPQRDRYQLGFQIRQRDAEKEPTGVDKKWAQQAETMVMRSGVTENPRGRDNFDKFVRKVMWDSLVYDQMCFEVVPDRIGRPCQLWAVDASSIRIADSTQMKLTSEDPTVVRHVQVYDGLVIAEFTDEELCFGVRNPRTDLRLYGYGVGEAEMAVQAITALLFAWEYNSKFFTQGSAAKGILNFKGTIPERQLRAFRRHWTNLLQSVENAWRTPITNAEDIQWVNLQSSARDQEFVAWMDFLIKVTCGLFTIDPIEINFKYGNAGQKSGLNEQGNREKITESKERGLRPLLRFLADAINQYFIWPINEGFEFAFVGLDAQTRDELAKLNKQRVETTWTVDEVRAEEDKPPLPDGLGEIILSQVWLQNKQAAEGMAMQGGPGGEEGDEDGEGGFNEDDWASALGEDDEGDDDEGDEGEDEKQGEQPQESGGRAKGVGVQKAQPVSIRIAV